MPTLDFKTLTEWREHDAEKLRPVAEWREAQRDKGISVIPLWSTNSDTSVPKACLLRWSVDAYAVGNQLVYVMVCYTRANVAACPRKKMWAVESWDILRPCTNDLRTEATLGAATKWVTNAS